MFGSLENGEAQMQTVRQTWDWALGDLALGPRSEKCVRAFDRLTNDMLRGNHITMDEFLAAQTVIGAAYAGATQIKRIAA